MFLWDFLYADCVDLMEFILIVCSIICSSEDSVAQWIRRWSTKPEILGSIPSGVVSSDFFAIFFTTRAISMILQASSIGGCLESRKWTEVRKWESVISHFPIYPNTEKRK